MVRELTWVLKGLICVLQIIFMICYFIRSSELAKLSGLSGISDIIGDMVAKGDIDLDDVGLTTAEADRLVQRGAIR